MNRDLCQGETMTPRALQRAVRAGRIHRSALAVVLLVASLAGGCFGSHGSDDGPNDAATVGTDAGSAVPPGDGGRPMPPRRDGGRPMPPPPPPPPPPVACDGDLEVLRAEHACIDDESVPPGIPWSLRVIAGGCFCGARLDCQATVGPDGTIDLVTQLCQNRDIDCDGCDPEAVGTCELPALAEGTHTVRINGEDAFELPVAPLIPGLLPALVCWDAAPPPPRDYASCDFPGSAPELGSICGPSRAATGRSVTFRAQHACAGCTEIEGGCEVQVIGDVINIAPRTRTCDCPTCGACPDICHLVELSCTSPALGAGSYVVRAALPGVGFAEVGRVEVGPPGGPPAPDWCLLGE